MPFKKLNNLIAWVVFGIALAVYILSLAPGVSFWDCGEFIASAWKLEVGHPPGAPVYMLLARLFSLLSPSPEHVPFTINLLSAVASAFTIFFLYHTISLLLRKIPGMKDITTRNRFIVIGGSMVGALAYAFTDSFWFSAVEAEVYAISSLFTALVFWAILKWDEHADSYLAQKWIFLIAFLIGLSVGIHLLNLLAIPALILVYYFRKYQPTPKGVIKALFLSALILLFLMEGIITGLPALAAGFEKIFVNGLGFPFNSGLIFFVCLVFALIAWGVWYSYRNKKYWLHIASTSLLLIMIGYSSYAVIMIRSAAKPPMDQNNPENIFNLATYLKREQYGDRPLIKGQYFSTQTKENLKTVEKGKPFYLKEDEKYVVNGYREKIRYNKSWFFPRMWSPQQRHVAAYRKWSGADGNGKPSAVENLRFLVRYQLGHMYFRYFMWNFAGRQNDIQGHGSPVKGNWLSGIKFLDEMRLGKQDALPPGLADNPARNTYFFLPLLMGIIGAVYHFRNQKRGFWIVALLFFMTGIAIVIYLNQYPLQPRERDYSFAGSFYAFGIWIGFGAAALIYQLMKWTKNRKVPAVLSLVVCVLAVPGLLAFENYDDHDRSGRYAAGEFAYNYLNSCAPNAILFTKGDNDTFPLWYLQEVEGVRTDVRVINLSYLNAGWYVDQQKRRAYDAQPAPIGIKRGKYAPGKRNTVLVYENPKIKAESMYAAHKSGIDSRYQALYALMHRLLESSKFPELNAEDYKTFVGTYDSLNVYSGDPKYERLRKMIRQLAKPEYLAKYRIDMAKWNRLSELLEDLDNYMKGLRRPLGPMLDFVLDDGKNTQVRTYQGWKHYLPAKKLCLKVSADSVLKYALTDSSQQHKIVPRMEWNIDKQVLTQSDLIVLDILRNNHWKRPVYFSFTVGSDAYLGLDKYFKLEGFAYRIMPMEPEYKDYMFGTVNTQVMEANMRSFKFASMTHPGVYLDENIRSMGLNVRNSYARLAYALYLDQELKSAEQVLDTALQNVPSEKIPYGYFTTHIVENYYRIGCRQKADALWQELFENTEARLHYYYSFPRKYKGEYRMEIRKNMAVLQQLMKYSNNYIRTELEHQHRERFMSLYENYEAWYGANTRR